MPLPSEISTTLLLSRPARIDVSRLRLALETRLAPNGPGFAEKTWRHAPLLSAPELHLHLQARDLPLSGRRLDGALASGFPTLLGEEPAALVARHRAAITVTLGLGPTPSDTLHPDERPTQQAFDALLILGHAAATQLARDCHPLALHWGQSDQILSPVRFMAMADMLFPLPLFLHPLPQRRRQGDTEFLVLEVAGAEALIGHSLRTAPVPATVGLSWMMQRVYAFVAHMRASSEGVTDGMSFATDEGERFLLRIDADGGFRLVLEQKDGQPVALPDAALFSDAA